tara:strand:- start:159 stop:311 length:153 start_codon:yes stop_codon:yes gene_type:complete
MGNNTIYYILGIVAVVYLLISMTNKRQGKKRKSRKFMEGYKRKEKTEDTE